MVDISLTLGIQDPLDEDADDSTGLTNAAYERLTSALSSAGFDIVSGPDAVASDE